MPRGPPPSRGSLPSGVMAALRLLTGAELNEPDKATFYGGDAKGYVDYPAVAEGRLAA